MVDAAKAAPRNRLRIRAATTFARLHVIPELPRFLAIFPDLEIEMTTDDPCDRIEAGIDVVLRIGGRPNSLLTARKLGRCRRVVVGAVAYLARADAPRVPADLCAHPSVIYDRPTWGEDWIFRRGSVLVPVTMTARIRVTAVEGVREAVIAGLGLAVASEWMFTPELANGTIVPILRGWTLPPVDLWALFPRDRPRNPLACAFIDFVKDRLSS